MTINTNVNIKLTLGTRLGLFIHSALHKKKITKAVFSF